MRDKGYKCNNVKCDRCVGHSMCGELGDIALNCIDRIITRQTNAQKIRLMSDEELAEFLTNINPTNCQDCAFSCGWRCQPDRDDYSDVEKCEEGRKRWLQQPAEEDENA